MDDFSQSWKALPWKKFQKHVFNIQKRIFEAIRTSDYRRAKNLQKLLLISRAARFLAVRKIIQLNKGKKTAGIDKKTQKHYNFKKRFELVEMLATKRWEHQRIRRIEIPKKDGRSRKLGIPTIQDRVWQELTRMAIEPAHEATFHSKSYGFRPGRSTQDAQKIVFQNLRSSSNGIDKRVLSLDIKACFDKISHDSILKKVICPGHVKENIHRCLNSGTDLKFQHDENEGKGTQQGGVISPLLANIALDGIEGLHKDYRVDKGIRYADDILYILKPEDDVNKIMSKVVSFLSERGLEVNKTKTKL